MKAIMFAITLMFSVSTGSVFVPFMEKPKVSSYEETRELHLRVIRQVESNNGQNTNHKTVNYGLNAGHVAFGAYGLMPLTIKDIVRLNKKRFKKHAYIQTMSADEIHEYLSKNKGLEDELANAHYDRLAKMFGQKLSRISYAWFMGPTRTLRDLKEGVDLKQHWHVAKTLKTKDRLVATNL